MNRQKVALITGSAQGIGRALALHLAKQGITVVVHYRSSARAAKATLRAAKKTAPYSTLLAGDITQSRDVDALVRAIKERYGRLDILINNVGNFGEYHSIDEVTIEEFDDVINSNLRGTFLCMRRAVPLMRQGAHGRIINLACVTAEYNQARKYTVPYYIAKGGVVTLTKSWAQTLIQHGITVNAIAPGVVENSVIQQAQPAQRAVSYADINQVVDFLLAEASQHITGSLIEVTGGWAPGYRANTASRRRSSI